MTFSRKDVPCARWNTMSFEFIKKLPTPAEIRKELPLPAELVRIKEARDAEIRDVLTGKSNKFLVIIGPCSADNEDSVCDYVNRLAKVNEKVKDKLILVPRIYTNKPRTTGEGYKGITSQPDPEKKPDFLAGLMAMRKMHIRAIKETGLTAADEMLYPENWGYVSDILSYVAIGARSVEDQQHRLTVSGFDVAAGMKNPTSGDFSVMLNSVYAVNTGINTFIHHTGYCGRPGRDRCDHTDGCCGGINNVCQLCSGNLMSVCYRHHNRAYSQTVKIVIHENQNT